jgi:putative oxidoreductase
MNQIRPFVTLFARILIVAVFLMNGFGILDQSVAVHEMIARGVSPNLATLFGLAGRAVEIFAGIGLALGLFPEICAAGLIAFLIPATLIAHPFWIVGPKPCSGCTPRRRHQVQSY